MIGPTGAVRVMVATKPVDFRKGAEGLSALVRETMTADPFSGAVYVPVPTKPAMHSNLKPAGYSNRKPATLGVNRMGRFDDVVEG